MYNSFYRKVGFGIGINDKVPTNPLKWATDQLDEIPELLWTGWIPSEKEMRIKYGEWIVYDPELNKKNLLLWAFPLILFIIGGILIFRKVFNN